MDLSLLDKIIVIFKYMFSSFPNIFVFIVGLVLFSLMIINLKLKNKTIGMILLGIYLGTFFGVILSHFDYVEYSVREAIKLIMNYIYFPSPVVYFFIVVFMIINNVYTLFKDMGIFKKIFNYICSFIIFLLFFLYVILITTNGIDLGNIVSIYSNETVLSIVQISNLLFVVWIIVSLFYKLYLFYKKKVD